ncbi:MAG TPA: hypothetical protein VHC22_18780 [Pirellulales bacterium]|nr:hypothetical protein [Pirellulales bacterium]
MSYQRIPLERLPSTIIDGEGVAISLRQHLEETEHNVEDVLLCLQAMRVEDVPAIGWSWEENAWHPEFLDDEHYPQYFVQEVGPETTRYHAIWSVPLCKREVNTIWRDGERYLQGHGRQVLVFDYKLELARSGETDRLTHDSIRVVMGLHEAAPLRQAYASAQGNRIKVDSPLLVALSLWIDELKDFLKLERQVLDVLERRAQRHSDRNLHTNE